MVAYQGIRCAGFMVCGISCLCGCGVFVCGEYGSMALWLMAYCLIVAGLLVSCIRDLCVRGSLSYSYVLLLYCIAACSP